jgi:hypothetical protein
VVLRSVGNIHTHPRIDIRITHVDEQMSIILQDSLALREYSFKPIKILIPRLIVFILPVVDVEVIRR